ncbi:ATP-binding cassette, subfamily C [Sinosporangium album]|uniref:ATP-binding cassette, subfamily C n=1 Tax=Sinosporangium album TaxID=504805 RepID=A0A1G7T8S3_9ACTN|nr:ABC transporter ATP-binding protein [Sinosporangium album]SDG31723.1 ATP-binding cassette, subfamily C [Sinosporangium album]
MSGVALLLRVSYRTGRRHYAAIALWSVLESAPAFISGHAVARALDEGFTQGRPLTGFAYLGLFAVAAGLSAFALGRIVPRLGAIAEPLRDALVRRVVTGTLHQAAQGQGARPDTAVVARLTQQVELVRDSFAGLIMVVRDFAFTIAGVVAGLVTLLPAAVPLVAVPVLVAVALFVRLVLVLARRQRALVLADEDVASEIGMVVDSVRDIVAAGAENGAATRAGRVVDAQARAARRVAALTSAATLSTAVGGWLPIVLLLFAVPGLFGGGATAGEVLGAMIFVLYGVQPALRGLVTGLGGTGLRLAVTADRLLATTAIPPEPPPPPAPVRPPRRDDLVVRRLTFAYGPAAEPVLRDLDLRIPEGDHLAVVGPSGIGKSTLAALLAGLLTPGGGEITLGGRPLGEFDPDALPRRRVLIPQEAYVFTGSLADNLRYLRPTASDRRMEEAAEIVGLAVPQGLAERVEPARLSAERRQLIALTRAYLSPAGIVILDEATCHLGAAAEARAEAAMAARPGTLIVIAHRMSSALRARRTLVLDGISAEVGGHADLLHSSPLYRDLSGHWRG